MIKEYTKEEISSMLDDDSKFEELKDLAQTNPKVYELVKELKAEQPKSPKFSKVIINFLDYAVNTDISLDKKMEAIDLTFRAPKERFSDEDFVSIEKLLKSFIEKSNLSNEESNNILSKLEVFKTS